MNRRVALPGAPVGARPSGISRRQALGALAALMAGPLHSRERRRPTLRLGTSTPGGGFHLYGETLARLINAGDTRVEVVPLATQGTAENLERLRKGGLDIALVQGTAADELIRQDKLGDLVILQAMYPSPGMLAVPAASPARMLSDLKGQAVVWGVAASGLVMLARKVFEGIGLDIDRDFRAVYVKRAADAPALVLQGEAAGLWGAGEGWPGFLHLAQAPGGARFLAPTPAEITQIRRLHPLLQALEVPAGSYPGLEAPLQTVGSVNFILARANLDAALAKGFVEAVEAVHRELSARLPQAAFSTRANTLAAAPAARWLHPVLSD